MRDNRETAPVFACARDEHGPEEKAIGRAPDRATAARMLRKYYAELHGDGDTGITARTIHYLPSLNAYFVEE